MNISEIEQKKDFIIFNALLKKSKNKINDFLLNNNKNYLLIQGDSDFNELSFFNNLEVYFTKISKELKNSLEFKHITVSSLYPELSYETLNKERNYVKNDKNKKVLFMNTDLYEIVKIDKNKELLESFLKDCSLTNYFFVGFSFFDLNLDSDLNNSFIKSNNNISSNENSFFIESNLKNAFEINSIKINKKEFNNLGHLSYLLDMTDSDISNVVSLIVEKNKIHISLDNILNPNNISFKLKHNINYDNLKSDFLAYYFNRETNLKKKNVYN